eukprot:scaffold12691_cov108-Isochrysis_galbana.AAC.6
MPVQLQPQQVAQPDRAAQLETGAGGRHQLLPVTRTHARRLEVRHARHGRAEIGHRPLEPGIDGQLLGAGRQRLQHALQRAHLGLDRRRLKLLPRRLLPRLDLALDHGHQVPQPLQLHQIRPAGHGQLFDGLHDFREVEELRQLAQLPRAAFHRPLLGVEPVDGLVRVAPHVLVRQHRVRLEPSAEGLHLVLEGLHLVGHPVDLPLHRALERPADRHQPPLARGPQRGELAELGFGRGRCFVPDHPAEQRALLEQHVDLVLRLCGSVTHLRHTAHHHAQLRKVALGQLGLHAGRNLAHPPADRRRALGQVGLHRGHLGLLLRLELEHVQGLHHVQPAGAPHRHPHHAQFHEHAAPVRAWARLAVGPRQRHARPVEVVVRLPSQPISAVHVQPAVDNRRGEVTPGGGHVGGRDARPDARHAPVADRALIVHDALSQPIRHPQPQQLRLELGLPALLCLKCRGHSGRSRPSPRRHVQHPDLGRLWPRWPLPALAHHRVGQRGLVVVVGLLGCLILGQLSVVRFLRRRMSSADPRRASPALPAGDAALHLAFFRGPIGRVDSCCSLGLSRLRRLGRRGALALPAASLAAGAVLPARRVTRRHPHLLLVRVVVQHHHLRQREGGVRVADDGALGHHVRQRLVGRGPDSDPVLCGRRRARHRHVRPALQHAHPEGRAADRLGRLGGAGLSSVADKHRCGVFPHRRHVVDDAVRAIPHVLDHHAPAAGAQHRTARPLHLHLHVIAARRPVVAARRARPHCDRLGGERVDKIDQTDAVGGEGVGAEGQPHQHLPGAVRLKGRGDACHGGRTRQRALHLDRLLAVGAEPDADRLSPREAGAADGEARAAGDAAAGRLDGGDRVGRPDHPGHVEAPEVTKPAVSPSSEQQQLAHARVVREAAVLPGGGPGAHRRAGQPWGGPHHPRRVEHVHRS